MTFQDQVKIKTVKWNLRQILEAWETQIWPLFHNIIHQVFGQIFVKIFLKKSFWIMCADALMLSWWYRALSINSYYGRTGADRVNSTGSWWLMVMMAVRTCPGLLNNNNIAFQPYLPAWDQVSFRNESEYWICPSQMIPVSVRRSVSH